MDYQNLNSGILRISTNLESGFTVIVLTVLLIVSGRSSGGVVVRAGEECAEPARSVQDASDAAAGASAQRTATVGQRRRRSLRSADVALPPALRLNALRPSVDPLRPAQSQHDAESRDPHLPPASASRKHSIMILMIIQLI